MIGKLFPRCNCNSDRDLAAATNNAAVQIAYGKRGLAQFWGCYDKGKYYCWKGWRYGKYCSGTRVKYGSWRYNSISYNWPYASKKKSCPNDLF